MKIVYTQENVYIHFVSGFVPSCISRCIKFLSSYLYILVCFKFSMIEEFWNLTKFVLEAKCIVQFNGTKITIRHICEMWMDPNMTMWCVVCGVSQTCVYSCSFVCSTRIINCLFWLNIMNIHVKQNFLMFYK